jgi:putative methyltransferase
MATGKSPLRVLISNINPAEDGFFVPLIYGNLRTYWEYFEEAEIEKGLVDWLDPLMIPESFEEIDRHVDFSNLDVLAISVYQWNYAYQYELARFVRVANPNCLIVAGGPHVEFQDPGFFVTHDFVDLAVTGEGEESFRQILKAKLLGQSDYSEAEGVRLNPKFGNHAVKPVTRFELARRPSPWLALKDFWRAYFARYRKYRLAASYESSRGCPYACTFCDWGSATNSKMRLVDTEIAKEEIDFLLGELKPSFVFWTDSNLGMAARDLELVKHFVENKIRHGFPRYLYYSNNKNSYERNLQIAKEFRRANLLTKYTLSLQHLDEEVIENLKRKNLPSDQIHSLVRKLEEIDYPVFVQFIVGSPGDTFEKWLGAYARLMELGVHSEYRAYPFNLLPNSPAASQEYMQKWGLRVIERADFVTYYYMKGRKLNFALSKSKYVVGSSSYTEEDYIRMHLVTWMIMAFHDHGLTRFVAMYLRDKQNVSYQDFYRGVFEWFVGTEGGRKYSSRFNEHIRTWLKEENSSLMMFDNAIEGYIEAEESFLLDVLRGAEGFYQDLGAYLRSLYDLPVGLLEFQKSILFTPDWQPNERLESDQYWAQYFGVVTDSDDANPALFSQFPRPWYLETNDKVRLHAFYSQVVQHNVSGRRRTAFKMVHDRESTKAQVG